MSKLKTAFWFIRNPQYFPQIFQVLKRRKNEAKENSSSEATQWCQKNAISQSDAFEKITKNKTYEKIDSLYKAEIDEARKKMEECPVKMGGEGAISFIYNLTYFFQPQNILETGVAYGWSSLAILLAIKDNEKSILISNDMPYIKMNNDDYVGCIIPDKLRDKWQLQRLPDIKGIPKAIQKFDGNIDFCHYDSDKSYTGRMWSAPIIWKALNKGGIFISDDINDNIAFKEFCDSIHKTPIIIEHKGKYVGILIK